MLADKIDKPGSISLNKIATDKTGGLVKEKAQKRLASLCEELAALQELMYAASMNSLLVVMQGRDTSGKDGSTDDVGGAMNPVGIRSASFKVPTPLEAAHDFLWRIHAEAPAKGEVVFFNRSHYEDVLVTRVHDLVPKKVWEKRYDDIRAFEEMLAENGTLIVKIYLHISRDEQKERLLARESTPEKAWKLNPEDWKERAFWDQYTDAYEDAIGKCAAPRAPWYVIPADHKWFRNLALAEILVETLRPHKKGWMVKLDALEKTQRAALQQLRDAGTIESPKAKK